MYYFFNWLFLILFILVEMVVKILGEVWCKWGKKCLVNNIGLMLLMVKYCCNWDGCKWCRFFFGGLFFIWRMFI